MPGMKLDYVVTSAGNMVTMAKRSLNDKELMEMLSSRATCSGCNIYFLQGTKVTVCGHRVCNQCWLSNEQRCPNRRCGDDKKLENYDISSMDEIGRLFVNCPLSGCREILSYAETDAHIAAHNLPEPGQNNE
ncbi:hypothetical protein [Endozoicomonas acroporae]|uniref:hypothetical protein n=2 Tax=Endozoicomonas acroporae TaxID=1701104 RepID=UPI0015E0ED39|nr:hypothetical protein [Endozoicomonas acroporae]